MRFIVVLPGMAALAFAACDGDSSEPDVPDTADLVETADHGADADADADAEPDADSPADSFDEEDAAADAEADVDAEPETSGDGGGETLVSCESDDECTAGEEWCGGEGLCVPCDNGGLTCEMACQGGWELYERNGCHPCECAPINDCTSDGDCPAVGDTPGRCYVGRVCLGGEDLAHCHGNVCAAAGCEESPSLGCAILGGCDGGYCTYVGACDPAACRVATCSGGEWTLPTGCACGHCTYGGEI